MNHPLATFATVALALAASAAHAQANATIHTVMLRGTTLCIGLPQQPLHCLADDKTAKAMPLWSQDGTRIAYIAQERKSPALAWLVVIDRHGKLLSKSAIKPELPGEIRSGMRFVEALQWLGKDKIVVSGSVNPGTTEYNVIDLSSGKTVKEFFDDGHVTSFSPDGQHYTSLSGSPHFTPTAQRAPILNIDNVAVLNDAERSLAFPDQAQWSPDSRSVAIHAVDSSGNTHHVVHWNLGAKRATITPLPLASSAPQAMFWLAGNLQVQQKVLNPHPLAADIAPGLVNFINQAWRSSPGLPLNQSAAPIQWVPTDMAASPDPQAKGRSLRARLEKAAQPGSGAQADFWCQDCELSALPRQNALTY